MTQTQIDSSIFPQMFSGDRRIRVRIASLADIDLSHLCTSYEADVLADAMEGCSAGTTEWTGRCDGQVVSIAWDWVRLQDGAVKPLKVVGPRTNLQLLDAKGYDLGGDAHPLWNLIESQDWRQHVPA